MTSTVITADRERVPPKRIEYSVVLGVHFADVISAEFLDLVTLFRLLLEVPGVLHLVLNVVEHAAAEEDVEHVEGQEHQPT